jgi:uncharacterized protein YxjI
MKQTKSITPSKSILTLSCFFLTGLLFFISANCSVTMHERPQANIPPHPQAQHMKRYFMKQKVWTIAERFIIRDEYNNPMFYVKGKVFSIGDKLKFYDMDGRELAYIKQEVFSFNKRYKIYKNHRLVAKVVKKLTLFKDKFIVDVPGPDDYFVKGNFTDHHYNILRNGRKVAAISKNWMSWGDAYRIEIVPGEDDVVLLGLTVIIDMVSHDNKGHNHSHYSGIPINIPITITLP